MNALADDLTHAATTDELLDALMSEAAAAGANPAVLRLGAWVGVIGDESWLTELGYDRSPWADDPHPRDPSVPLVLPTLAAQVQRVAVVTRSVVFHNPPLHNGAPLPPAVNSERAVIAFIPHPTR